MQRTDSAAEPTSAAAVFGLLSHEIRLTVVCALCETSRSDGPDRRSFSDLRAAAPAEDSGQFSYHLDQLTGVLVDPVEEGYELTRTGRAVCRTFSEVSTGDDAARKEAALDSACDDAACCG